MIVTLELTLTMTCSRVGTDHRVWQKCGGVHDYLKTLRSGTEFTRPEDVAEAVWRAVTEPEAPMKTLAGADAQTWFRDAGHSVA